jgi:hypothetical protein
MALFYWDDEAWTVLSTRYLEFARQTGARSDLPVVLANRIASCLRSANSMLRRRSMASFKRSPQ